MPNPTSARATTRPIYWAYRMLRDPSLVEGASAVPREGRSYERARTVGWLFCGRSS